MNPDKCKALSLILVTRTLGVDERHRKSKEFEEAASPEHKPTYSSPGYMSDAFTCACGWSSRGYWDGVEYAYSEWHRHVLFELGFTPRKCACGKRYTPADGEQACHELIAKKPTTA